MEVLFNVKEGSLENATSFEIACAAVKVLDTKKAGNIKVLKIDQKSIIADYFVICTGNSSTQIKTLTEEVEYQLGVGKVPYVRIEGVDSGEWRVIDCHDIIVHVFSDEARSFYKLEKLWADAEEVDINSIVD